MSGYPLIESVEKFTQVMIGRPDADLEQAWAWNEYDSEGIRFAFFRTYEELRELAVRIEAERAGSRRPLTSAQRILGRYQAAYRDLQSVLLGVAPDQMNQAPGGKEWTIRRVLAHVMSTDVNFYVVVRYALDGYRANDGRPRVTPDDTWNEIVGMEDDPLKALFDGSAEAILAYHAGLNQRILVEFAGITQEELSAPSRYWESYDLDLRFRLHRFESHLRQHTIQVEKTLAATGAARTEVGQLARMLYRGLADVEASLIGGGDTGAALVGEVAKSIAARADEVAALLKP